MAVYRTGGYRRVYQAPRLSTLKTEPLLSDELILLGAVDDPAGLGGDRVPTKRLADIPVILPARPHGLRVLIDNELEKLGVVANVVFEVDAMPSTLSLVERGVGYTVLSEGAVKHLLNAGRIRSWLVLASDVTHYYEHMESGRPFTTTFHVGTPSRVTAGSGPLRRAPTTSCLGTTPS